jgi:CHAT domain-containing protein/tetratricopeptide (TPR) repeat protein
MASNTDGDQICDAFFAALERRDLEQCMVLVAHLRDLAQIYARYRSWYDYLMGVLANERDRDWAESERIFTALLPTDLDLALRGRVLVGLGRTYDYQGRWSEAIAIFEESLTLFEQLQQPLDQAKVWKNIAHCWYIGFLQGHFGVGVLHQAVDYCQSALAAIEQVPATDTDWLAGSVWNALGLLYGCLNQWDQAITCFHHDLDICTNLNDQYGMGVSYLNMGEIYHRRGAAYWPAALDAYQHALQRIHTDPPEYEEMDVLANLGLLYQDMGQYEQALHFYDRAIACIETLRSGISSEDARAGFLATTIDTYALAILLHVHLGQAEPAFTRVEQARSRAFLDGLATRSADLSRHMTTPPMTLAEIQSALPVDTLLLEYFTTGLLESPGELIEQGYQRHRFPPARILLFAVTHDTIQIYDTGLSPNDLYPSHLDNPVERHFLQPVIRQMLYTRLIAPIAHQLPGMRRLYLVPHGPLHYIPFQALIAGDGTPLLHETSPPISYAPSATILFRPIQDPAGHTVQPCLALGYNGSEPNRLRFGEDEARSVADLTGGTALTGPSPKKTTLYTTARQYRLLHLSCHGTFDPESPLSSALHLAPGETLTALDVLQHLRLQSDIVCLSACESGLSRIRRGDELVGLVRAFLYAGASIVICTLWRVDERSTRILMERLYQEILAEIDPDEALKRAQLYLRTLTVAQVRTLLIRSMVSELLAPSHTAQTNPDLTDLASNAQRQAHAYVKSLTIPSAQEPDAAATTSDDDRIFADPYYWAPFILIGHPDV